MERTLFSSLVKNRHGQTRKLRLTIPDKNNPKEAEDWRRGYIYIRSDYTGQILGKFQQDDLFDAEGNRFEMDV